MDASPALSAAPSLEALDLTILARATLKTFERLVPYSQLRDPSSTVNHPAVSKIVKRVKAYLQAIDRSVTAVQIHDEIGEKVLQLCAVVPETRIGTSDDKAPLESMPETELQRRIDGLVDLASRACTRADEASNSFKQVQQELYKIAALTKDQAFVVDIPVDPPRPETLKKPLKDIGSDLVANLNLLAQFAQYTSDLASWCTWVKSEIAAARTPGSQSSLVPPLNDSDASQAQLANVRAKWEKLRADYQTYRSVTEGLKSRYPELLQISTTDWTLTSKNPNAQVPPPVEDEKRENLEKVPLTRKIVRKASSLARDAAKHLACHGCIIL